MPSTSSGSRINSAFRPDYKSQDSSSEDDDPNPGGDDDHRDDHVVVASMDDNLDESFASNHDDEMDSQDPTYDPLYPVTQTQTVKLTRRSALNKSTCLSGGEELEFTANVLDEDRVKSLLGDKTPVLRLEHLDLSKVRLPLPPELQHLDRRKKRVKRLSTSSDEFELEFDGSKGSGRFNVVSKQVVNRPSNGSVGGSAEGDVVSKTGRKKSLKSRGGQNGTMKTNEIGSNNSIKNSIKGGKKKKKKEEGDDEKHVKSIIVNGHKVMAPWLVERSKKYQEVPRAEIVPYTMDPAWYGDEANVPYDKHSDVVRQVKQQALYQEWLKDYSQQDESEKKKYFKAAKKFGVPPYLPTLTSEKSKERESVK